MTTNRGKPSAQSVCQQCPSAYECGKLYSALQILEMRPKMPEDAIDPGYIALLSFLKNSSFGYPDAQRPCELQDSHRLVRDLTSEAIGILEESWHTCRRLPTG